MIRVNPEMVEHIFLNLIHNAIRYTPPGGKAKIQCQKDKHPGFVQITVSDTGIGIPQESLSLIFDDFYRADNAEIFEKSGTGLGPVLPRT